MVFMPQSRIDDLYKFDTWLTLNKRNIDKFAYMHDFRIDANEFNIGDFIREMRSIQRASKVAQLLIRFTDLSYGRELDVFFSNKQVASQIPDYFYGREGTDDEPFDTMYSALAAKVEKLPTKLLLTEEFVSRGSGPDQLEIKGNIAEMWWD